MCEDVEKWPVYAQCAILAVAGDEEMARATRALMAQLQPGETVLAAASAQAKGRRALLACTDARILCLNAQDGADGVLFTLPMERVTHSMSTIFYGSGNVTVFFDGGQQDFCCMSSHASTPMCRVIEAQRARRVALTGAEDALPAQDAAKGGRDGLQAWPVYAHCEVCAVVPQCGEAQATRALMAMLQPGETVRAAVSALTAGKRSLVVCTQRRLISLSAREGEAGQVLFALPVRSVRRALRTVWYGTGNVAVFYDGGQAHFCNMPLAACAPLCRILTAQQQST